MKISFSPPDITEQEINEVKDAMMSGWITTGPRTKELERQVATLCNTERAVCLNSATACLEAALRLLGIGPGDEVITSAYTYTASASVVCHVGARLVLIDTGKDSYEMDYDRLAEAVTPRTKAIIPVDLGGIPCDYDRIFGIVEEKRHLFVPSDNMLQKAIGRIAVVADSAHAFGASWHGHMVGEIADFTSFSFHAVKNFTTAEGGALTWNIKGVDNEELYRQLQLHSLHGQSKDALAKTKLGAWEYDIISTAYKCNMTDIAAAMGLVQMKRYPALLERRKEIIGMYDSALDGYPVQLLKHYTEDYKSSGHLYLVRMTDRDAAFRNRVITEMAERDIACNVHYKPLPMMTAYRNQGFDIKSYPNAYVQFCNEITLPLHTRLTDDMVEFVVENFKDIAF
ncbi:DegT/DnrJ/EryC1/StrS family aminotransferase [Xylanibacter caecicola]|uniref:DegT/DnrJ/EryC1/StrS family aminotransferase n=1 Tax=Xylanibacter caecicola TaxID=2736294 RepID=UPI0025889A04|nr:DegT/DnrJ/EryC1/StrS aminotransferase family protein [Xylanibacter caecicola]